MHRKGIELLIKTTIRRISAYPTINRNPPCSYFHLSRHLFAADQRVKKPAPSSSKEPITDFSNLNPDEFGTIAPVKDINEELDEMPEEEDDKVEFIIEDETGRKVRRSLNYYTTLIIKFLNERKIADAIDVLEERMLKRDKVKPNYFVYNLLINGCARVGYTLKAFKLYNEMKKRALKITPATYTALFNACANSPFPDDALIRVNHLRNEMMENGLELNDIQYNALIKAYARLHDVRAAFLVVDEMISRRFPLTDGTFVFLFQACAADKEAGFRHALILMHKMRKKHISPSVFVYNQFLRCVRDCGIGDVKETLSAIKEIAEGRKKNIQVQKQLESGTTESNLPLPTNEHNLSRDLTYDSTLQESSESKDLSILEREENRPNLLARVPHLGSIVKLNEVKIASDRLMLLGGFRNVLEEMEVDNVKPDIKTFTLLLDVIPSTLTAEEALLKELKKSEVHVDIDFYNMLIKKRAFRGDYQNGRAVLELIQAQYLTPDLVTFGVLALCCRTTPQAKQLLTDMNQFRYRLNAEILGGMLANACYAFNYEYVMFIMKLTKNIGVQPNEEYMEHLRKLIHRSNEFFNIKGNRKKEPPHVDNPQSLERYKMFKDYYKQWKEEVTVYVPPHPYEQFKVRTELTEEEEEELSNIENAPDIMKQKFKQGKIEYPGEPTRWKRNRTSGKPHVLDKNFKRPEERRRFLNKNFVRDDRKLNAASEETLTISCESRDDFHSHDEEFMERSSDGISTNDGNYDENYSDSKIRSWQSKNESHYDEMESRGGRRNRIPTNEGNEDENFSKRKLLNWRSKNEYPLDEIESRERNRNQIHYNDRNYNENLTGRKTFNRRMRNNFHSEELESSGRRRNHMQTDYRDDEPNFTRKIVWQRKNEK